MGELENIQKRAESEQESLEEGIKTSVRELEDGKAVITYNGKEFTFPKDQPAWVAPFLGLYGEGKDKELSDERSLQFLVKLIGQELAEEIIEVADNDFSMADLAEQIVQPIQEHWAQEAGNEQKEKATSTSDS